MIKTINKFKKFSDRIISNRDNIVHDLRLVKDHVTTIPNIFFPLLPEPNAKSELDIRNYNNLPEILTTVLQVFLPNKRDSISEGTLTVYPKEPHKATYEPDTKWFFINGIATAPPVALLNAKELANAFNRPINLIHTPTYSAAWDLWDSITARTFRKDGYLSRPGYEIVKEALEEGNKVILIGHSQGTIVSSYIMRKLLKHEHTKELAKQLEIYCIGGVADSMRICPIQTEEHNRPVPYIEHFANEGDFFARIGVFAYENSTNGKLFRRDSKGHLLNNHYIGGIVRGEFCDGESRLHKYVDGQIPTDDDFHSCPHYENNSYAKAS